MQVLVCSDIFGETPALHALLDELNLGTVERHLICPCHNTDYQYKAFDNEALADAAFTDIGGITAYKTKLLKSWMI